MEEEKVLWGLIGFPLVHSWSPSWFTEKFIRENKKNAEYRLFPLASVEEFPALLHNLPELSGLNVTFPYKEKIIAYLDVLDETAISVGAVNTIKIKRKNGVILTKGFNTDITGFLQTLTDRIPAGSALILGTGGAAKAVGQALREKGIQHIFVSRDKVAPGIISYHDLTPDIIKNHLFIINTTPLGLYPNIDEFPPIPYHFLTKNHCLYDLIYNPEETVFIKMGKSMHTQTINGRQMLNNQAELSFKIFLSVA